MGVLYDVIHFLFVALVMKSIFVGSEFSFYSWAKHNRKYTDWYFNKEQWKDHLNKAIQEEGLELDGWEKQIRKRIKAIYQSRQRP